MGVPTPSPRPSDTPPPDVTVTYTLQAPQHGQGHGRFEGLLTLVNDGSAAVPGWTATLGFPGDTIAWVAYPPGPSSPFSRWRATGADLVMTAATRSETLAPGHSQTVIISGAGPAHTPVSCTFDAVACRT